MRDPAGAPVPRAALQVIEPTAPERVLAARAQVADSLAAQGVPTWWWSPGRAGQGGDGPPLPPRVHASDEGARLQLQRIAASIDVAYGYPAAHALLAGSTAQGERSSR
ncbi:MAG TPA: hypothetical protein VHL79_11100 [Ramlibacter sp.]|nr:hypothetical protein [Ramlibacter sp.]